MFAKFMQLTCLQTIALALTLAFRFVFVSPDECESSILSLLALFLVSTTSGGKYLFL